MSAIVESEIMINDEKVKTFGREVRVGQVELAVEAGTTGYSGGFDRDAGGRTYVSFDSYDGDLRFYPITDEKHRLTGFELAGCGDDFLDAILSALRFATDVLRKQTGA